MQRNRPVNKLKIINDPVYGFINIPTEFHFDLIQNPYFQRLRRIKQLGLTHYVYPGAVHTRFDHVLGAMHLITVAIRELKRKGHDISAEEENAAISAILMHDIGHGPLSHSLENTIIKGFNHEAISLLFMEKINSETDGNLSLAIDIFKNTYKKKVFT
jgi:HD superfamily phosphohydrolase